MNEAPQRYTHRTLDCGKNKQPLAQAANSQEARSPDQGRAHRQIAQACRSGEVVCQRDRRASRRRRTRRRLSHAISHLNDSRLPGYGSRLTLKDSYQGQGEHSQKDQTAAQYPVAST